MSRVTAERSYTGAHEVDELLLSWGRVIARARASADDWELRFALSIQRARKRHG